MVYLYPAQFIFNPDENSYTVKFPDIKGSTTGGFSLKEAYEMAQDVLNLCLWDLEYGGKDIPTPSRLEDLQAPEHGFINYILADTEAYTPIMIKNNPNMKIDVSRIKKEQRSA